MITKEITYDHQILEGGQIQVRRITRIMEDGVELSKAHHRHVVSPGDSPHGEDTRTIMLMANIHTPKLTSEYLAIIESYNRS